MLDTCAALAGRRYSSDELLVLEVRDDLSIGDGRFALESSASGVHCSSTNDAPDLTLTVQALGAAYLGDVSLSRLQASGLVDEHHPGSVARGDRMFLTARAPWCATHF
jgi:predicted acetyltransferase